MASSDEQSAGGGPEVVPGRTALCSKNGEVYLVPDFILPAAKVAANSEFYKHDIDKRKATGGVSLSHNQLQLLCGMQYSISCDIISAVSAASNAQCGK